MTPHQQIFGLVTSVILLVIIIELVRRKKIKEEYSWIWIVVGVLMILLTLWYDLLLFITSIIGAEDPLTTLFLFGFLFLILVSMHYSMKISKFENQIKDLAQDNALLKKKLDDFEKSKNTS